MPMYYKVNKMAYHGDDLAESLVSFCGFISPNLKYTRHEP